MFTDSTTDPGGLGSLSTNPPTALKPLKPLKPPSAILDRFLHGRKPSASEVQLNEPYQLHCTNHHKQYKM